MERDPRVDPIVGDVIVLRGFGYRVCCVDADGVDCHIPGTWATFQKPLEKWREWAATATILERGDANDW